MRSFLLRALGRPATPVDLERATRFLRDTERCLGTRCSLGALLSRGIRVQRIPIPQLGLEMEGEMNRRDLLKHWGCGFGMLALRGYAG